MAHGLPAQSFPRPQTAGSQQPFATQSLAVMPNVKSPRLSASRPDATGQQFTLNTRPIAALNRSHKKAPASVPARASSEFSTSRTSRATDRD